MFAFFFFIYFILWNELLVIRMSLEHSVFVSIMSSLRPVITVSSPSSGLELFSVAFLVIFNLLTREKPTFLHIFTFFCLIFILITFYWHAVISKGTIMLRSALQLDSVTVLSAASHCRSLCQSEPIPCQKENLQKEDSCEEMHPQCSVQWIVCLWYSLWGSWRDQCRISGFGFRKGIPQWGDWAVGPGSSGRRNRRRALEGDLWLSQETNRQVAYALWWLAS